MSQSYMIELLERAFLLQQKRTWSLENLLKIERGQILSESNDEEKQSIIDALEGNLRVTRETLDDVARDSGYEPNIYKLFDPTFVLGAKTVEASPGIDTILDQVTIQEQEAGQQHFRSMCRDLAVRHEPYFEEVERRVRDDLAFYRSCRSLDLTGQSSHPTLPLPRQETSPDDPAKPRTSPS
jgi:hypothetical protein